MTDPFSLFQGAAFTAVSQFVERGGMQQLEAEGLQKVEMAVAGSKAEGLYEASEGCSY